MTTERRAPEGPGIVVFFEVHSLRFDGGHWREVATTSGGKPFTLVPHEYPASLPTEQLAEAWSDFCEEVAAHNRAVWLREAERREAARTRDAEARAAEELERGTSELFG